MVNLEAEVLDFVTTQRAVFYSDIARKFGIGNRTARDIVACLRREGLVDVRNKGISVLVVARDA